MAVHPTKTFGSEDISLAIQRMYADAEDDAAILTAVESLYVDELRPYARILRKRLSERTAWSGSSHCALATDVDRLRARCQASELLRIEEEVSGEWSVVLVECPPSFVNVYSTWDPYPHELWAAATSYFESDQDFRNPLPGGRYACAQALSTRNLPFLAGLSLGQICHFVQLAISHRKLLGYNSGALVPYAVSHSMVKDCCATQQTPLLAPNDVAVGPRLSAGDPQRCPDGHWPLATWDAARACMQEILQDALFKGSTFVSLSNVKRLFRKHCHCELSETALGHTKLSELLQDSRMIDICQLQLQPYGYIVRLPVPFAKLQPSICFGQTDGRVMTCPTACYPSPRSPAQVWLDGSCDAGTVSLSSHALKMQADASNKPLASSLGLDGSCQKEPVCSVSKNVDALAPHVRVGSGLSSLSPHTLSKHGEVGHCVLNTFIHFRSPLSESLSGPARRSRSVPRDLGSRKNEFETACNVLSYLCPIVEQSNDCCTGVRHRRVLSCTSARSTACATDEHSLFASVASDEDSTVGSDKSQYQSRVCSQELEWFDVESCA